MKCFFILLLLLLLPAVSAISVMPSELDMCHGNKVYVENNLVETAQYDVYNNEELVFSFSLEPEKRRGVYITEEGSASIEERVPESQDVINSVEIGVKGCGKKKRGFVGIAFFVFLTIAFIILLWKLKDIFKRYKHLNIS